MEVSIKRLFTAQLQSGRLGPQGRHHPPLQRPVLTIRGNWAFPFAAAVEMGFSCEAQSPRPPSGPKGPLRTAERRLIGPGDTYAGAVVVPLAGMVLALHCLQPDRTVFGMNVTWLPGVRSRGWGVRWG